DVTLLPNTSKHIYLPLNTLRFIPDCGSSVIQRGERLYNQAERTYEFDQGVKGDITLFLPWSELPNSARDHIKNLTREEYNRTYHGDDSLKAELAMKSRESLIV